MFRSLSRAALATLGLAASPLALAGDPAPKVSSDAKAASQYRTGRTLGTTGMIMGYAGPVVTGAGAIIAVGGAISATTSAVDGNNGNGGAGLRTALGGLVVSAVGWSSAVIGPTLLASGGLLGASGVRNAGGPGSNAAGWVAVGGSALQIGSLVGRVQTRGGQTGGGLILLGITGWATAMVGGTIQHAQNRSGWASVDSAQTRSRVQFAMVPTRHGGALIGTF